MNATTDWPTSLPSEPCGTAKPRFGPALMNEFQGDFMQQADAAAASACLGDSRALHGRFAGTPRGNPHHRRTLQTLAQEVA